MTAGRPRGKSIFITLLGVRISKECRRAGTVSVEMNTDARAGVEVGGVASEQRL
jgi:hypothetical protein